jgi:hypothetical protein
MTVRHTRIGIRADDLSLSKFRLNGRQLFNFLRRFSQPAPTIEPKLGQQAVGVPQTPFRRVPGPPVRHGVDTVKLRTSQGTRNGLRLGRDTFTRAQIRHVKPRTSDSPVVALVRRRRRR